MKLGYLGIGLLLIPALAMAQGNGKNLPVPQGRKPVTSADSVAVQQLYFEAFFF